MYTNYVCTFYFACSKLVGYFYLLMFNKPIYRHQSNLIFVQSQPVIKRESGMIKLKWCYVFVSSHYFYYFAQTNLNLRIRPHNVVQVINIYIKDYQKHIIVENCQMKLLFHILFTICTLTLPGLVTNMSQLFSIIMNGKYRQVY